MLLRPGVPAAGPGVSHLPKLPAVPQLTGPLLRLVRCRGTVSARGGWGAGGLGTAGGPAGAGLRPPCPCRCTRRVECPRAEESGHWLWSRDEACVAVTGAQPQNMSRRAQGEVRGVAGPGPGRGGAPTGGGYGRGACPLWGSPGPHDLGQAQGPVPSEELGSPSLPRAWRGRRAGALGGGPRCEPPALPRCS